MCLPAGLFPSRSDTERSPFHVDVYTLVNTTSKLFAELFLFVYVFRLAARQTETILKCLGSTKTGGEMTGGGVRGTSVSAKNRAAVRAK